MKIRNLACFLLVVILLATGTTPVIAHEVSQCGEVEPIRPGDSVTDAVWDVPTAHVDITKVETSLSGERLTVVFHLRKLPETLRFSRREFEQGTVEYAWGVEIDVDNDHSTGRDGFDMLLSTYHITGMSRKGNDAEVTAPIGEMLEASLRDIEPYGSIITVIHTIEDRSSGSIRTVGDGGTTVHVEADTITIADVIPGITSESRLAFKAHDMQFPGWADQIACHDPYKKSVSSLVCNSDAVLIKPGQTATDVVSDVSAAYLDIVAVSTSLAGETLTVAFRFRDMPETLTFNRAGTLENHMEYSWGVSIDVDNDRRTGDGGFEYLLSAHHIVRPAHAGDNTEAPIEEVAKADVWEMKPGGIIEALSDASLEASPETDMMILSGRIPGITPDSRLSFMTFKHLGESDELGCQEPPVILTTSSRCDIDGMVTPGESVIVDASDSLPAHVDVTEINTFLSGETLTVVFHFRDAPESLTFDRFGLPEYVFKYGFEYSWEVSVDVDGDQNTGLNGFEYILSAIDDPFPWPGDRDRSVALSTDNLQTNVWVMRWAGEDTSTLSAEIPGITEESQLAFGVYDYLGGAEEVGCLSPFGLFRPVPLQDSSDESAAKPGHSVSGDVSHELVGHIDIRSVTTALDGETLTVTFLLRDVPETLTFDRPGVPAHALEYSWEVSVDVDNDPATGSGGYDYMLSVGYFVPRFFQDSNTVAEITQPGFVRASLWGLDREGNRVLAEADVDVEVSADDNTITLSGEIPGITEASPLKFRAYDFFAGSVEMSSHGSSLMDLAVDSCQSDSAVIRPGERVIDAVSDALPAYIDITEVSSEMTGSGKLTVVFHLRDIPETLEFNRKGAENTQEYRWEVSVDVDNNRETGLLGLGAEYALSASHFVLPKSSSETAHLPVRQGVEGDFWKLDADGTGTRLGGINIDVSSEENTITLVGHIPGITSDSRLIFEAYDVLNGSELIACRDSVDSR